MCIDETKLDSSFPDHQFKVDGYQFPCFRRDRDSKGGGKMVFIRNGIVAKRLKEFETKSAESIGIEITIKNRNGAFSLYTDHQIMIEGTFLMKSQCS